MVPQGVCVGGAVEVVADLKSTKHLPDY
jgi:hypothetical protein